MICFFLFFSSTFQTSQRATIRMDERLETKRLQGFHTSKTAQASQKHANLKVFFRFLLFSQAKLE